MIGKSMARGDDESTPSAGAEAEGRSVGTRGWFIISECHWLTIIGELRSLWFAIIYRFCNPKFNKNNFLVLRSNSFLPEMGFCHPKKDIFVSLAAKKGNSLFWCPKKENLLFWCLKKENCFFGAKKGKILLFWSFLVSKNCLLVRPRKLSFGWNCSLNGILVPQKESLLSKGLFMLLDFF